MAEFVWKQNVNEGCILCMASVCERGFVDCISDVIVRRDAHEIVGIVDINICAICAEQIARFVGSATQQDTMEMAQKMMDQDGEIDKLKDEVQSWSQRFQNLVDAVTGGFDLDSVDRAVSRSESSPNVVVGAGSQKPREG